jgi:hypothetical protein
MVKLAAASQYPGRRNETGSAGRHREGEPRRSRRQITINSWSTGTRAAPARRQT